MGAPTASWRRKRVWKRVFDKSLRRVQRSKATSFSASRVAQPLEREAARDQHLVRPQLAHSARQLRLIESVWRSGRAQRRKRLLVRSGSSRELIARVLVHAQAIRAVGYVAVLARRCGGGFEPAAEATSATSARCGERTRRGRAHARRAGTDAVSSASARSASSSAVCASPLCSAAPLRTASTVASRASPDMAPPQGTPRTTLVSAARAGRGGRPVLRCAPFVFPEPSARYALRATR